MSELVRDGRRRRTMMIMMTDLSTRVHSRATHTPSPQEKEKRRNMPGKQ